ncbi:MAG TPA: GerMN domain-containing protein [Kineosporiaceae bacterium]|nr:GerMN domain-containing protein [Kineosporiaceae bacterium]
MRGARGAALLAAAVALLLAGCAGVPAETPVAAVRRLEAPRVQLFAYPPLTGDTPEGVVWGFLAAGADFHENHKVAREYLVGDGGQWQAVAPVVVLEGNPCPRLVEVDGVRAAASACSFGARGARGTRADPAASRPKDGQHATVEVTGTVRAVIDDAGRYTLQGGAGAAYRRSFALVARGGEWRVQKPPDGLLLSEGVLAGTFAPLPLYFGERVGTSADAVPPGGRQSWLVPDIRWFPSPALEPGAGAATVVRALLAGPSPWLADAVVTGASRNVALAPLSGVRIDDGVATVDLTRAPEQPRLLQTQLLATLQRLPTSSTEAPVTAVQLTVGQVKLEVLPGPVPALWSPPVVAAAPQQQGLREDPGTVPAGSPLCLTAKGAVGQILITDKTDAVCTKRDDLAPLTRAAKALLPAGDQHGNLFAVLTADARTVYALAEGQQAAAPVLRGQDLTVPSLDGTGGAGQGWVWAASAVPGGQLRAGGVGRKTVTVQVPWLRDGRIVSVRVSPEGTRALLVVQRTSGYEVLAAGVVRAPDGTPLRLTSTPLRLLPDLVTAADAVWVNVEQVAVLGTRTGTLGTFVWNVQLGGDASLLAPSQVPGPARPTGLAVSGNGVDVYVRTDGGGALGNRSGSWSRLGVTAPVMLG